MEKQAKNKVTEKVAQELIDTFNAGKATAEKDKIKDIETLCNFGILGLLTPREISEVFYNSFRKKEENKTDNFN
jgi:hypothetical protein